jgi:glycosyltransferase involved in cell wall biosynthesis
VLSVYAQTLPVSQLIIVDDGSTDDTAWQAASVLGDCRSSGGSCMVPRVLYQEQRGVSSARNTGIHNSAEEWIAFLDADDIWSPDKIEKQWELILKWPKTGLISCDYSTFRDGKTITASCLSAYGNPQRWPRNSFSNQLGTFLPRVEHQFFESGWVPLPSTVIVRREAFDTVGLFNEYLHAMEDFEYFSRILARYPLGVVEQPLVRYRLHETNLHFNLPLMQANQLKYFELVIASPQAYPTGAAGAAARGRAASSGSDYKLYENDFR